MITHPNQFRRPMTVLAGAAIAVMPLTMAHATGTPNNAASAPAPILYAASPIAIPGSYIVVLKSGTPPDQVADIARELSERYGGTVSTIYTAAFQGFALSGNTASAGRMAADPAVAYVEQDRVVHAGGSDSASTQTASGASDESTADGGVDAKPLGDQPAPPSWGLDRIDQLRGTDGHYKYGNEGAGVTVYLVDGTVRFDHTDFVGGRVTTGDDLVEHDYNANDNCGAAPLGNHGTQMAGTIGGLKYGVAKNVQIVAVRVLNCSNTSSSSLLAEGIDWVTQNASRPSVAVMNVSLPSPDAVLTQAMTTSVIKQTWVAAAGETTPGGGGGLACNRVPANVPGVIAIAATASDDTRWVESNYGSCVSVFDPGVNITTASNQSPTDWKARTGTDAAASHVTGIVARILEVYPTSTPAQAKSYLVGLATDAVINGGAGSPNEFAIMGGRLFDWGYDNGRAWPDVNGDKKADYCRLTGDFDQPRATCSLSTGTRDIGLTFSSVPQGCCKADARVSWVDFNGDKKADYCRFPLAGGKVSCTLMMPSGTAFGPTITSTWTTTGAYDGWTDLNADGKADYCRSNSATTLTCNLSQGGAFATAVTTTIDRGDEAGHAYVDYDGDGSADYCRTYTAVTKIACNKGLSNGGFVTGLVQKPVTSVGDPLTRAWPNAAGDGRADFCRATGYAEGIQTITCSHGNNFAQAVTTTVDIGNPAGRAWADHNGDGKADFCRSSHVPGGLGAACVTIGASQPVDYSFVTPWWHNAGRTFADYNGDGKADFVRVWGDGLVISGGILVNVALPGFDNDWYI